MRTVSVFATGQFARRLLTSMVATGLLIATLQASARVGSLPSPHHMQLVSNGSFDTFTTYQPPELWGGSNAVEQCNPCTVQDLTKTPGGRSTQAGQAVNAATGDFSTSIPLFSIPEPGSPLNVSMTYDAYLAQAQVTNGADGQGSPFQWGWGWQFSLGASLSPQIFRDVVNEDNGAQVIFTPNTSGTCPLGDYSSPSKYTGPASAFQFCAPYRVDAQLSEFTTNGNVSGWALYEDKGRRVLSFSATGQLTNIGTFNLHNVLSFSYGQTHQTNALCPSDGVTIFTCTIVTDMFGRNIVIEQGQITNILAIIDPMGRTYSWTWQPNSSYVTSISNPDGTWAFGYSESLAQLLSADMTTETDPNGNTRHIAYDLLDGIVTSITDFANLDTTQYAYPGGSCSNQSCTGPGDTRTTTVTYSNGELDTNTYYEGLLTGQTWGTSSSGPDQSTASYWYFFPANDQQHQDSNIILEVYPPNNPGGVPYVINTDAVGNLLSVKDPNGNVTTYQYDTSNNFDDLCWVIHQAVTNPSCGSVPSGAASFTYDTYGNRLTQTDFAGKTTRYGYYIGVSTYGQLCWVAQPTVTGSGGNCTSSPGGAAPTDSTAYSYDGYDNVATVNTAYNDATWETTTTSAYDLDGEISNSIAPNGYARGTSPGSGNIANETTYLYDGAGRLQYLITPGPEAGGYESTTYAYDADGNVTTLTRDNSVTTNAYDGDDRLCWTFQGTTALNNSNCALPSGGTGYAYSYDTTAVSSTTNPDGQTTSYQYGDIAFSTSPTAVLDPMSVAPTYTTYNTAGEVCATGPVVDSSCTWVSGDTYNYYDVLRNRTITADPLDNITTYAYGSSTYPTLVTTVTNPLQQVTGYTYDADGRQTVENPPNSWVQVGYDGDGRQCFKVNALTLAGCSNAPTATGDSVYSYDPLGHLATMTDYGLGTSLLSYDNSGNLILNQNDNGQPTIYAYDAANDVTCVGYPVVANPNCGAPGSSTNTVVNYTYQYVGKISSTMDWLGNATNYGYTADGKLNLSNVTYPSSTGESINYGYDPTNFLTSANYTGPAVGTQSQSWTPNADSLVSATSQLGSYNSSPTYDSGQGHNWLASATNPGTSGADAYQYQLNGELSSDLLPSGLGPYYGYNSADQLSTEENTNTGISTTFANNANGERCWSAPIYVSNPGCASPASGSTSYAWNSYGQLCWTGATTSTNGCSSPPAGMTSYQYDGMGLRATSSSTSWGSPTTIDGTRSITSVSCPTTSFCMAVDASSAIKFNGSTWATPATIDGSGTLQSISCVSASFCEAVDNAGHAFLYNGSSWFFSTIDSGQYLQAVSCASSTFCVAVDLSARILKYTGSWGAPQNIDGTTQLERISCVSSSFCVATDLSGYALTYNGSSWTKVRIDTLTFNFISLSCSSSTSCVAVDNLGRDLVYNGSSWTSPTSIDSSHVFLGISCSSSTLCRAVDNAGNVFLYNGASWSSVDIDGSTSVPAISCADASTCEVVDNAGKAVGYGNGTAAYAWDLASGGGLPRLLVDSKNAYIYGPTLFGSAAPVEEISLATGTTQYLSSIPSGVQLVFGSNGILANRSSYSTYGTQLNTIGAATPFGFQGGYTDPTGLIYLVNRYYDPSTGQFISVDPKVRNTGQPYAFAGDNPTNASDPSGLQSGSAYSQAEVNMAFFIWIHGLDAWLNFVNSLPPPPASTNNPFLWGLLKGLIQTQQNLDQARNAALNEYMSGTEPCGCGAINAIAGGINAVGHILSTAACVAEQFSPIPGTTNGGGELVFAGALAVGGGVTTGVAAVGLGPVGFVGVPAAAVEVAGGGFLIYEGVKLIGEACF